MMDTAPEISSQLTADGWINWRGGECPVPAGTLVNVRLRDGLAIWKFDAARLAWNNADSPSDIVAYRVAQPEASAEPAATPAAECANDSAPVTAPGVLDRAAGHMRDRAATYDAPGGERSMGKAVHALNSITGLQLDESHGWLLMLLLKNARLFASKGYHDDSAEDAAAYAALLAESKWREGKGAQQ